jgi:hypothetical protein
MSDAENAAYLAGDSMVSNGRIRQPHYARRNQPCCIKIVKWYYPPLVDHLERFFGKHAPCVMSHSCERFMVGTVAGSSIETVARAVLLAQANFFLFPPFVPGAWSSTARVREQAAC